MNDTLPKAAIASRWRVDTVSSKRLPLMLILNIQDDHHVVIAFDVLCPHCREAANVQPVGS